jgi:hypothetical protein
VSERAPSVARWCCCTRSTHRKARCRCKSVPTRTLPPSYTAAQTRGFHLSPSLSARTALPPSPDCWRPASCVTRHAASDLCTPVTRLHCLPFSGVASRPLVRRLAASQLPVRLNVGGAASFARFYSCCVALLQLSRGLDQVWSRWTAVLSTSTRGTQPAPLQFFGT